MSLSFLLLLLMLSASGGKASTTFEPTFIPTTAKPTPTATASRTSTSTASVTQITTFTATTVTPTLSTITSRITTTPTTIGTTSMISTTTTAMPTTTPATSSTSITSATSDTTVTATSTPTATTRTTSTTVTSDPVDPQDLNSTFLTPMEQMMVDTEVEETLDKELSLEQQLTELDQAVSRSGTTVSKHSQFTFSSLNSVLLGRKHRIRVIRMIIIVRVKVIFRIFLPLLFHLGFGAEGKCSDECPCDDNSPYRTASGHCNNLVHTRWGMASIPMRRWLYPDYDDGIQSPRQRATVGVLPSARLVSTTVHVPSDIGDQHAGFTHILMQWGQFLDHDLTSTPQQQIPRGPYTSSTTCCVGLGFLHPFINQVLLNSRPQCFPIQIPPGDRHFKGTCMNFVRSVQVANANCQTAPVEQLNQVTGYIDASQVYGSSQKEQNDLRTFKYGMLKELNNHLPNDTQIPASCPSNVLPDYCFQAGDHRVNENPTLQSMHTIFMREHNRIARILKELNCHWRDERIFQETRKIIGAFMQVITYDEYLPILLGPTEMTKYGLTLGTGSTYTNVYSDTTDASIRNAFATAAFRMGHSMIKSFLGSFNPAYTSLGSDQLSAVFGTTHPILSIANRTVGHYCRGLVRDTVQNVDSKLSREVTDHLFRDVDGNSLDLAALNIQRGRDHGLPSYNKWRRFCNISLASTFDDLVLSDTHSRENADNLKKVYKFMDDIDLFPGALSEKPVTNGLVGPTFACLLGLQFQALKRGDRFWFEEDNDKVKFTPDQLEQLRNITLSSVICSATDTTTIQKNSFIRSSEWPMCTSLQQFDLTPWKETLQGTWKGWSTWGPCKEGIQTRTRTCWPCDCACDGSSTDTRSCNPEPCGWSPWNPWSQCKIQRKYRTRECQCPGCNTEIDHCH